MKQGKHTQRPPSGWRLGLVLPSTQEGVTENASIAAWLVSLRWVALGSQILAGIVGFKYVFLEPLLLYPFFGAVFFLLLFNGYSLTSLRENPTPSDQTIFLQVAVDTLVFSFLLALSGGTKNPFVPLLFVHATLGALLLRGKFRGWFAVLLLTSLLALFKARDWQVLSSEIYVWELIPLFALFISLFISWVLVASLSDTLRVTRSNLTQARSREDRINHLLALGALTAEFAHQFATPLNTLRIRLARLKRHDSLGRANPDIKAISETLDQSENILREMTTAPLDSSMLLFEEVDISTYVAAAVSEWRANNPDFLVTLNSALSSARCRVPTKVFAKSLFNLLDNAASVTALSKHIELELEEDSERLFICVLDRGPGWPTELTTKGIRPHFTTRPGGTGLGLFNCQSLCEVMGGSLELLDRKGGGAIARLALPKSA